MIDSAPIHPRSKPLGWKFYVAVSIPTLVYLWAASYPGYSVELRLLGLAGTGLAAVKWGVAAVSHARGRTFSGRIATRFAVAAIVGILILGIVLMDAPLRTRWALSKGAFEKRLATAQSDPEYRDFDSQRLGTYKITMIERNHDAVVFREALGSFFDDSGFAYLPQGPKPEYSNGLFESPSWRHLGGHWYAWTASW